jgi:hypothetical protein
MNSSIVGSQAVKNLNGTAAKKGIAYAVKLRASLRSDASGVHARDSCIVGARHDEGNARAEVLPLENHLSSISEKGTRPPAMLVTAHLQFYCRNWVEAARLVQVSRIVALCWLRHLTTGPATP